MVSESGIAFNFDAAKSWVKHDEIDREWPAVDFILDSNEDWVWLEIKYRSNLKGIKRLVTELRDKFLGTTAYLAHTGKFQSKPLHFIAIIDSVDLDDILRTTLNESLNNQIRTDQTWAHPINAVVMTVADWNSLYPEYPARVE